MELKVGTCGWSYPDWVGPFYPPGTESRHMLARYARVFETVEVNSSFYAIPPRERVRRWAGQTPEAFDFSVKAPRELTHEHRLVLGEAETVVEDFVAALAPLGTKLATVLIQLPPSLDAEEGRPRLEALLQTEAIPAPLAVEARHPSWDDPEVYGLLSDHDATWVWSENDRWTTTEARTSRRAYLRLIGDREIESFDPLKRDPEPAIRRWQSHLELQSEGIDEARVYANNHFAGFAPGTVNAFLRLAGEATREWGADEQGGQAKLEDF